MLFLFDRVGGEEDLGDGLRFEYVVDVVFVCCKNSSRHIYGASKVITEILRVGYFSL